MTIRTKLFAGVLLILATLFIAVWGTFSFLQNSGEDGLAINVAGRQRMLSQKITKEILAIDHAESDAEAKGYRESLAGSTKLFDDSLNALISGGTAELGGSVKLSASKDPKVKGALEEGLKLWQTMRDPLAKIAGGAAPGSPEFKAAAQVVLEGNMELLKIMNAATLAKQDALDGKQRSLKAMQMGAIAFSVLAAVGVLLMVQRQVLRPLDQTVEHIRDLAEGSGDLSKVLDETRKDELGVLAQSLNLFTGKINDLVRAVTDSANQISSASSEISHAVDQVSVESGSQVSATEQVSAAVEEAIANVQSILANSDRATNEIESTGEVVGQLSESALQSIQDLSSISDSVESTSKVIDALGKSGEHIGGLISVINDIADQTNLLALNAAIEAARAGEHGRGFAVVADEVRKLADRTTKATAEITDAIVSIQTGTDQSIAQMTESTQRVASSVERARGAQTAAERAMGSVSEVTNQMSGIAMANKEQTLAVDQIGQLIGQVAQATRNSATQTADASTAVAALAEKAGILPALIKDFNLNASERRTAQKPLPEGQGDRRVDPTKVAKKLSW